MIAGSSYLNLARILEEDGRQTEALIALDSCLAFFDHGAMEYYCQCLQVRGSIALSLGRLAMAERELERALEIAREVGQTRTQIKAMESLRELYKRSGRFELALRMADEWQVLTDSVNAMDARSEMLAMGFKSAMRADSLINVTERERQSAEGEARLAKERNRRNLFLYSGLGLLVFGLVVVRQRNRIRREHDRSEALLLNILPQEVAAELKEKGNADAKHFDSVSILFSDFKGFTQLSEQVTPAELVAELNTCFKAFDGIMEKYRIEKIKTIGDAYMAAGGLPDPQYGSPADVVRAALEMQEFMRAHKVEREAQGKPYFEMRVGIHSGPVVAGIVGVKKFQYDIWGDTVNTASRMESSGEVGQVNISEATYEFVKEQAGSLFDFTPRGKVQAKGKGEMEMYFVSNACALSLASSLLRSRSYVGSQAPPNQATRTRSGGCGQIPLVRLRIAPRRYSSYSKLIRT